MNAETKIYIFVEGLVLFKSVELGTRLPVSVHEKADGHEFEVKVSRKTPSGDWEEIHSFKLSDDQRSLSDPLKGAIFVDKGFARRSTNVMGPSTEVWMPFERIPNLEGEFFCGSSITPVGLTPLIDIKLPGWYAVRRPNAPEYLASVDARALEGIWDFFHGEGSIEELLRSLLTLSPKSLGQGAVTAGTQVSLDPGSVVIGTLGLIPLFNSIVADDKGGEYSINVTNFPSSDCHSDDKFKHRFHTMMIYEVITGCTTPRVLVHGLPDGRLENLIIELIGVIPSASTELISRLLEELLEVMSPGKDPVCPSFDLRGENR